MKQLFCTFVLSCCAVMPLPFQERGRTTCTCVKCMNVEFKVKALCQHLDAFLGDFKQALLERLEAVHAPDTCFDHNPLGAKTASVNVNNLRIACLCSKPTGRPESDISSAFHSMDCLTGGSCDQCGVQALSWELRDDREVT
jgi:hypothetical protein